MNPKTDNRPRPTKFDRGLFKKLLQRHMQDTHHGAHKRTREVERNKRRIQAGQIKPENGLCFG